MPALRRPPDRRHRSDGADAGVDEAAHRALRHPLDLRRRRHHQLRHAGTGPAAARLRRPAARRRRGRALRARRRDADAVERPGAGTGTGIAARRRREEAAGPGRDHGRRAFRHRRRHHPRLSRRRVLESRGDPGQDAAPRICQRRRLSLRARRGLRRLRARRRARDAIDPGNMRRPRRPVDRFGRRRRPAPPRPRARAHRARRQDPRRRVAGRGDRRRVHATGLCLCARRRRLRRHPAVVPLRPGDRGGFHRGSGADARLRRHSRRARGPRPAHAARSRNAAIAQRAEACARRSRLAGNRHVQLRRFRRRGGDLRPRSPQGSRCAC